MYLKDCVGCENEGMTFILYGGEKLFILKEEHSLKLLENKVLRKTFVSETEQREVC
jgi:hypothetical protein